MRRILFQECPSRANLSETTEMKMYIIMKGNPKKYVNNSDIKIKSLNKHYLLIKQTLLKLIRENVGILFPKMSSYRYNH